MNTIALLMQAEAAASRLPYLAAILMVLIALGFLWSVRTMMQKKTEIPLPVPIAVQEIRVMEEEISPQVVAVIAAAVATTTGRTHRVVSIRRQSNLWEKVGRQSVLTSHRIR